MECSEVIDPQLEGAEEEEEREVTMGTIVKSNRLQYHGTGHAPLQILCDMAALILI